VTCTFPGGVCPGDLQCAADNFCHDTAHPTCVDVDAGQVQYSTNVAFMTSEKLAVGTIGGIAQANAKCQSAAEARGLPGMYHAWLATQDASAQAQLGDARGWVRVDNRPFVDTVTDLLAGRILSPLRLDETGVDHADGIEPIATGAHSDGLPNGTCADYTSSSGLFGIGRADGGTFRWSDDGTIPCDNTNLHLYCFAVDRNEPAVVPPPAVGAKRAFVTDGGFVATALGRDAADMECMAEAALATIDGVFAAYLATTTQAAIDHVGAGPWVRLDGVDIGTLDAPLAALNLTPTGNYTTGGVWTGAPDAHTLGDPTSNCSDWTGIGGDGITGDRTHSSNRAYAQPGLAMCGTALGLYCFEQ